jgi:hypothetical protein
VMPIIFSWPDHSVQGDHTNAICANPQRWQPMSIGTDCFADLTIANGLNSCNH